MKGTTVNDTKIELTLGLINGVLQYLGTRPYAEVFTLIQAIQEQATPQVPVPEIETSQTDTVQ